MSKTEILFSIPLPAMSLNRWTGGNKRFITSEAKHWTQDVQHACSGPQVQQQLALIRDAFSPKKHSIGIWLHFISPREKFYNKQGLFSSRTCDLSNVEKTLIDVLFLERHSTSEFKNLQLDDKYVSEMHSKKSAGSSYVIEVKVWIIDR